MRPAATPTQVDSFERLLSSSPLCRACWATCLLSILESTGWSQMWLGMFQSTSNFKSPRCNCWMFPVTFLLFSLTNCTNKMTSGRYQCLMSFKFWTLEVYAGCRVCDETSQANMEHGNHWLTVVILYFIVVGNNFFFSVSVFPCLITALHEQFRLKIPSIRRWNINGSPLFKVRVISYPGVRPPPSD